MNKRQVKEFLERNKVYVGFGNYALTVKYSRDKRDDCHAEVEISETDGSLDITLYNGFSRLSYERQENYLLHELIHGRVSLQGSRIEQIIADEEEKAVNDITTLCQRWEKVGK